MSNSGKPVTERMERYIVRVPFSGCWLWTGSLEISGYGKVSIPPSRWDRAHRVMWEATHGDIPAGLCVLHHCDVRSCCNPEHLFLGPRRDNNQDKARKGRGFSKLPPTAVPLVRAASGSHTSVAKRFAISRALVGAIKRNAVRRFA